MPAERSRMFRSQKIKCLSQFSKGQTGTVVDMALEPELQGRLMGMGLFIGTKFKLLRGGNSFYPLFLAVGETRISLGNEIAKDILAE